MLSSNKVIKASHASNGKSKAKISTEYEQPIRNNQSDSQTDKQQDFFPSKEREAILKEAEEEKQTIIESAQADIERMKKEAYAKGHELGQDAGLEAGYQEGYHQGFDKGYKDAVEEVELENEAIRAEAIQMLQEAHKNIKEYESARKEEFLKLASHMAEKIVHDYIDQSDDGLLSIAKPYFYQIDKEEEFVTITVHPSRRETIEKNLDEIKSISPGTRFMILGNPSLEDQGMLIESSHSIVDLQIKNQLERMLEEFKEMERTIDA